MLLRVGDLPTTWRKVVLMGRLTLNDPFYVGRFLREIRVS
jgi:hypothetical protein